MKEVSNYNNFYAENVLVHNKNCFTKDTQILMADGNEKQIQDIGAGEEILAWDFEKQKEVPAKVTDTWAGLHDDLYIINDEIEVTSEHPFWTKEIGWASITPSNTLDRHGWKPSQLGVGQHLMDINENYIEITSIEKNFGEVMTYNLEDIENYNNYFAENILVHNKATKKGNCGDGICSGSESAKTCPKDCEKKNQSHGNISLNRQLLEDPKVVETMERLLNDKLSESDLQKMITIVPNAQDGVIPLDSKIYLDEGVSKFSVKFTYTGQKKLLNLFAYEVHPKYFAHDEVDDLSSLGGTHNVVESDPSYLFYYPEIYPGQIVKFVYTFDKVLGEFDINTVLTAIYATGFGDVVCNSDGVCNVDAGENSFGCSEDCPFFCVPDENRCMNDNLEICNVLGEAWELEERCEKGCDKESLICKEASIGTGNFLKSIGDFFKSAWIYIVIVVLAVGVVIVGYFIYRKIKRRQSSSFSSGVFLDKRYKGI